jgi:hypothetical protein
MTREPRTTQKEAAWEVMGQAYMAASGNGTLPASARQIFYQARPKIMAMTEDRELAYGYFSQTLLPDYIEEHELDWNVVYDARGHFEEPHTNQRIGCGTIEVGNYLRAMTEPSIVPAEFSDANIEIIGPVGNLSGVLFCEKEGFNPLFKAVNLANRFDLMIISTKGVSVTAARQLIDNICGDHDLPLFVLHDFDVAGFLILGTLQRDTRRYQFSSTRSCSMKRSWIMCGQRRKRPRSNPVISRISTNPRRMTREGGASAGGAAARGRAIAE